MSLSSGGKRRGANGNRRQVSAPVEDLLARARRTVCRGIGHSRSRPSVHREGDHWRSTCARCGAQLLRVGAGSWRELTFEELTAGPEPIAGAKTAKGIQVREGFVAQQREDNSHASADPLQNGADAKGYTVNYFARKHHITRQQARDLIGRIGRDRKKLNAAAEVVKIGIGAAEAIRTAVSRKRLRS